MWDSETAIDLRLSQAEAVELYRNAPLHSLMNAAHQRRNAMHGAQTVTYLIDRNINYTNICTINCQFCSFYRPPGHAETYTQTIEEISSPDCRIRKYRRCSNSYAGGVNPEFTI